MKDILIIYTHPGGKGHNAEILKEVTALLKKQNQSFKLIDLYKDHFNPVLSAEDMMNESKKNSLSKYQLLIKDADKLIFIFPIWWGAVPAILKGFFDKNFTRKFAFTYEKLPFPIFGLKAKPVGLLTGKKALVLTTTGGPNWANKFILANRHAKLIKRGILDFCGISSKVLTLGGCSNKVTKEKKIKIKKMVKKGFDFLF